ncbi:MAG: hypothetical protein KA147_02625 [Bacteroidia bacterium]|jgi:hypothetical protein|uniref:hypothetical protein n=1 Tax=Candidatus Pollutiaquabacter sp. TaxID=3416354 RepID=UPI001B6C6092|nr:hypothetical protein [Bacteroidota bacterium]MBP7728175.1 hypothetical protein [Bacteroidia bacterium]MBP7771356.1 hypothetical protein [Bacteroidia bacterium]
MKSIISITIGVIVYVAFSMLLTPFIGYNFGTKTTIGEKIIKFFIEYPFGIWKYVSENHFILMLLLNGIFWSIIIIKGMPIVKRIVLK